MLLLGMRSATELSANVRGMCRSPKGWADKIHDEATDQMLPSALAVLAANESRFLLLLVKLSGVNDGSS